jgi:hypothetical protein
MSLVSPGGLPINFNLVYSGYDGVHNYQVPSTSWGWIPGA